MPGVHCVSEADLRSLLLGELPEPIARLVTRHLELCPECEAAAQRLDGLADPFLGSLRQVLGATPGVSQTMWASSAEAAVGTPYPPPASPGSPPPPETLRIAGYEVVAVLGRGGSSVVYEARQLRPERVVALKMLLGGVHADAERRARFLAEADAIARLRHPHIVQIHEVGSHDGLPFLSLEFMDGGSLANWLGGRPRPPREAAALLETLARAAHYAHTQGVVHRDLKPGNVLLQSLGPTSPAEQGQAEIQQPKIPTLKISDFGLAKYERPDLTTSGAIVGTPSYMAPEQAAGHNRAVGPATDVYALGAILYELLTGRPPFQGATVLETLEQVETQEPVPPSQFQARTPRDLCTVCLKCLQKEPGQRYASAEELAADLGRFLAGQPILARRSSGWERTVKWARRRPRLALLLGLVAAVTALGSGGVVWQWQRAEAALEVAHTRAGETEHARQAEAEARGAEAAHRGRAETALARAETALYSNRMALAERMWAEHNVGRVEQLLDLCRPEQRGWEWLYLRRLCRGHHDILRGHTGGVMCLAFSPDGRRLASGATDGTVRLWDPAARTTRTVIKAHGPSVQAVAFSPDGRLVASGAEDKTVKLWDAATAQPAGTLKGHTEEVKHIAFSPDGRLLASAAGDATVRLWDVGTRQQVLRFTAHKGSVEGVAFSPDGRRVASASRDGKVLIWEAATGGVAVTFKGHDQTTHVLTVAFSPDGRRIVSASWNDVKVWDAATGREYFDLRGHTNGVQSAVFTPDGRHIVTGSHDQTIKVWDAATGAEVRTLRGHTAAISCVAVARDGRLASAGGWDRTIRLWDVDKEPGPRILGQDKGWLYGAAFSPDGRLLAVAARTRSAVEIWDVAAGRRLHSLEKHTHAVYNVAFSPDGRRLASASQDGSVRVWDVASGRQLQVFSGLKPGALGLAFSPDGRRLAATAGSQVEHWLPGLVYIWDTASGRELVKCRGDETQAKGLAFSPDGRFVAGGWGNYFQRGDVRVWDAATGRAVSCLQGHRTIVNAVAFSPDGRRLASASHDKSVRLWDVVSGRCLRICVGHTDWVTSVAFSADGRRLASAAADRTVRLWDTATGQQTLVLQGHAGWVLGLAFTPDGRQLATCGADGRLLLWDATPLPAGEAGGWAVEEGGLVVTGVGYTPDGQTLATGYEDGTVRLWDLGTGWERRAVPAAADRGPALVFAGAGPPLLAKGLPATEAVRLLDAATGQERGRLPGPFPRLTAAALAADGRTLATVEVNQVRLWDTLTGKQKGAFSGGPVGKSNGSPFTAAAPSPDGRWLVAGRKDGDVVLWDALGTAGPILLGAHRGAVTAVLFTPDGRSVLSGGRDGCVLFWDVASRRQYATADVRAAVRCLALCPEKGVLAVGDSVGFIRLLESDTQRVLATLEGPTAEVQALAFAPGGETLCLGSASGTVKLWRVAEVLAPLP